MTFACIHLIFSSLCLLPQLNNVAFVAPVAPAAPAARVNAPVMETVEDLKVMADKLNPVVGYCERPNSLLLLAFASGRARLRARSQALSPRRSPPGARYRSHHVERNS